MGFAASGVGEVVAPAPPAQGQYGGSSSYVGFDGILRRESEAERRKKKRGRLQGDDLEMIEIIKMFLHARYH